MMDKNAEILLAIVAGAVIGGVVASKTNTRPILGIIAGGAVAALIAPRVIKAVEQKLDRQLTVTELLRLNEYNN